VSRANVSLRAKEAVVAFDPAQVTVEQMVEAVKHLGFQASLKGSQPSATPPAGR
jgi:copper chaperone CopZ